ncbi:MAG: hypothetical protein AABX54_04195 [Nanoarchaeota archaeon]
MVNNLNQYSNEELSRVVRELLEGVSDVSYKDGYRTGKFTGFLYGLIIGATVVTLSVMGAITYLKHAYQNKSADTSVEQIHQPQLSRLNLGDKL